jgi:hypothetical protein
MAIGRRETGTIIEDNHKIHPVDLGMPGQTVIPLGAWHPSEVMRNQPASGSQAVGPLATKQGMQIDVLLKNKEYRQDCHHKNHIQKEPGQNLGE